MTPLKIQTFIEVYSNDSWVSVNDLFKKNAGHKRTLNKHLHDLSNEGFLDRVEATSGGYRYQVSDSADLLQIKTWAKVFKIPVEMQKKPTTPSNRCAT